MYTSGISPAGRENSQELAISGFGDSFAEAEISWVQNSNNSRIWRSLSFVLAIAIPMLVFTVPARGSFEPTLTADNILALSNRDRGRIGLLPLRLDARLQKAALEKARDILENDYFSHISPSGTAPWDFIRNQGFKYLYAGENLALNYTSPYELVDDFLKSPSHRENLLSPFFSEIGIAVVRGNFNGKPAVITVQLFASPAAGQ